MNVVIFGALSAFKKILKNRDPSVIFLDIELTLTNFIKMTFLNMRNHLCVRLFKDNVFVNCKNHFEDDEEFDIFMSCWIHVAYSTTPINF